MTSKREKEVLLKILNMYKDMPQLWDKSHGDYKNRTGREEAYEMLLSLYNEFDPDVTLRQVKKKIENLRTNYFKELKKVNASKLKGESYVPTLWYYDALSFLGSPPAATESCFCTDPLSYEVSTKSFEEERSFAESRSEVSIPVKKRKTLLKKKDDVLNTTENPIRHDMYRANKEEFEVYGKSIGYQLRDLKNKELTIALKLIADVIFYAKMGKLTEDAQIVLS